MIRHPEFWLYDHIFRMTGAFTALVSAGIGTVLSGWEPWTQIVPAVMATWWVIFCLLWFPRRYFRAAAKQSGQLVGADAGAKNG